MTIPFFLNNLHFAVNIVIGLLLFAVAWLEFDSWKETGKREELPKMGGILLLAISYALEAVYVRTNIIPTAYLGVTVLPILVALSRLPGYLILIYGLWREPLPVRPNTTGINPGAWRTVVSFAVPVIASLAINPQTTFPILAATVGWLYLRRGTIGLERHLRHFGIAFYLISTSGIFSFYQLFQNTTAVNVYTLTAPFGFFWWLEHIALVLVAYMLGRWVFTYLLKRFQSQLFIFFISQILGSFIVTSVVFTGLLLNNIQSQTIAQLEANVKVLRFALDSKQAEVTSDAELLAQNSAMISALVERNEATLATQAQEFIVNKDESFLWIVDANSQVLARGEDPNRLGDSLSSNPLLQRTLIGEATSSVVVSAGALAPDVSVRAAAPVIAEGQIIGAVILGERIDSTFVDSIKTATNLDTSIYAGRVLAASTVVGSDGTSRQLGTIEPEDNIAGQVLDKNETYAGSVNILSIPYIGVYTPLTDLDNVPIGMLFVGQPQLSVLQTAGRSMELTFIATAILIILSIYPTHRVAKYLAFQIG